MSAATKTALVTGATGGIGAAVASVLSAAGFRVLATGRHPDRLAELAERHATVTSIGIDLTDPAELAAGLPPLNRLDALVHCAGIADIATVSDSRPRQWRQILEVNLVSAAELTRILLPALRLARGHVVFVNASFGMTGVPGWSAYVGSKAALRELADSLREEEAASGVRVTSVFPGGVATDLLRTVRRSFGGQYDPAACISPDSLARIILSALQSPDDAMITDLAVAPAPPR